MPTLDDLPILATASSTGDDLIPVYDLTAAGSSKVRKLPLNSVLGLAPTGDIASVASTASLTPTTRVTVITGTSQACQLVFPSAAGVLRELIVTNQMTTAAVTPPALSSTATTLSAGSVAAFGGTGVVGATARFLSNGTGWYRVG